MNVYICGNKRYFITSHGMKLGYVSIVVQVYIIVKVSNLGQGLCNSKLTRICEFTCVREITRK